MLDIKNTVINSLNASTASVAVVSKNPIRHNKI